MSDTACPTCERDGLASQVIVRDRTTTCAGVLEFADESGERFHVHDPNRSTLALQCSQGHRWSEDRVRTCWCGWAPQLQVAP